MIPAPFEYHAPTSLREALALLRRYPGDAKVLAGGHSLIPVMKLRLLQPTRLVDLRRIAGLDSIGERAGALVIGPMATYAALERSPLVRQRVPALAEAAGLVGDVQVRSRGTIGGSLAHGDPAGDLPAVIVALEARIRTAGGRRARTITAGRFFLDAFTTSLGETEVITEIVVPALPPGTGGSYRKFANKASRFAVVGVASFVTLNADGTCRRVRLGITGAGYKPARARAAERHIQGREPSEANIQRAAGMAARGIDLQEDIHGSAEFREHLTRELAYQALVEASGRALR